METNQNQLIVSDPFTETLIRIKARLLCRRSDFSRSDYPDLRQSMCLYLLEKAHWFDPARGNLQAFVTSVLKTWTAMELRHRSRAKRSESLKAVSLERTKVKRGAYFVPLGEVLLEEDGRRLTQTQSLPSIEEFELRKAVEHALAKLEPEDRAMLIHAAEHGVTRTAQAFSLSRRQVVNAIARARVHFEKSGLGSN